MGKLFAMSRSNHRDEIKALKLSFVLKKLFSHEEAVGNYLFVIKLK